MTTSVRIASELSAANVRRLVDTFRSYCVTRKSIYKNTAARHRMPNFPEDISENIIRQYIINIERRICTWNTRMGDLYVYPGPCIEPLRVEVKCFSSTGPLSFGPNNRWDELYWLDATKLVTCEKIKIYKTCIPFHHQAIQTLPVSKKETFGQQCQQNRRPRFTLAKLKAHAPEYVKLIYEGTLDGALSCSLCTPDI